MHILKEVRCWTSGLILIFKIMFDKEKSYFVRIYYCLISSLKYVLNHVKLL